MNQLSKLFYVGLIMIQIVLLILKLTGLCIFNICVSDWSWFLVSLPILFYVGIKYLYGLSESLSNILNYLLRVALVIGVIWLIFYIMSF